MSRLTLTSRHLLRSGGFLLLLASAPALATAQEHVAVSAAEVRVRVALPQKADSLWTWNQPTTPNGRMEYAWMFVVQGRPEYSVGWMLFKFPNARPVSGPLTDMLRSGQASVFGGAQRAQMLRVRPMVSVGSDSLTIELRNAALVAEVFRAKPDSVEFQTVFPGDSVVRRKLPVRYVVSPR